MSVYIRKDSKDGIYSYNFQLNGRRFSGSTGQASKRAAEQFERARRDEIRAELRLEGAIYAKELTMLSATARYWNEVGQHHVNAPNTLRALGWLTRHFGENTMLHDISDGKVAAMVAKRRGEMVPNRKGQRVGNSTVNRTTIQPLREIWHRARKVWKAKTADINWSEHMLKEPKERIREASRPEEDAIMAELGRGYDDAVKFAFLSGCRRMEIIGLEWSRIDFFGKQFTVIGKGSKKRTLPMTAAIHDLLWAQIPHRQDKQEAVFTYQAARTVKRDGKAIIVKGQRYPLTEAGLKTAVRRAMPKSGVKDFRFHDMRHTAATRILRGSNLKVVQQVLGHEDIKTTTKYAHALMDDMRAAMEAATHTENRTTSAADHAKILKEKGE